MFFCHVQGRIKLYIWHVIELAFQRRLRIEYIIAKIVNTLHHKMNKHVTNEINHIELDVWICQLENR
jgi:hypothetical protein